MLFPFHRKKYCLVLSGGGTKGIYEIGVWKALRELHIPLEAVIGTSIGALNGLWVAQDDFASAEKTWDQLSLDKVLRLPGNFSPPPPGTEDWKTLDLLWRIYRRKGMLDNSPLRTLVQSQLKPERLLNSKLDYGIVSYNLSKLQPEVVFVKELRVEVLVDYLMASSTFPGFNLTSINRNLYLDGGLADNVPYEIARARGYRRLIVVDIGGIGVRKPLDPWGTESIFIKNSDPLGHVLEFRHEFLQRAKLMGYLDTYRVLNKYEGERYYLKPNPDWYKEWNGLLNSTMFTETLPENLQDWRAHLPAQFRYYKNPSRFLMEMAAESLGLERLAVYTPEELTADIMKSYAQLLVKVENDSLLEYKDVTGRFQAEWKRANILLGLGKRPPLEIDVALRKLGYAQTHPWVFEILLRMHPRLKAAKVFLHLAARWSKSRLPASPLMP